MNKTCETWIELYGEELGKEIHEILERISADSSFWEKIDKILDEARQNSLECSVFVLIYYQFGLTLGRIMFLEALEYTAFVLLPVAIIAMGYLVFKATVGYKWDAP